MAARKPKPEPVDVYASASYQPSDGNNRLGIIIGHVVEAALDEGLDPSIDGITISMMDGVIVASGKAPGK